MRRLLALVAVILIGLVAAVPTRAEPTDQSKNLIKNGLFERFTVVGDVTVGENWWIWVTKGKPKFGVHGFEAGQQIMSEREAFVAGIYQEISGVKPGAQYYGFIGTASLYWGNTEGKLEEVCRSVGIDPNGGTDPQSPSIVWGNVTCANKRWEFKDDPLAHGPKVRAIANGPKITFFVKVEFLRGDNLAQAWFMDAAVFLDTETPSGTPTAVPSIYTRPGGGVPDPGAPSNQPVPGATTAPAAPAPAPSAAPPTNPAPVPSTVPPTNPAPVPTIVPDAPPAAVPSAAPAAPPSGAIRPEPDYPILANGQPIGRFFTQTAKNGSGYSVADRGTDRDGKTTRWWTEFQALGGLDTLGYPISTPYTGSDGFLYQAFQRGLLQWRPELGKAVLANTFDLITAAGKDDFAKARGIPLPVRDDGSNGVYSAAVATRLGYLTDAAIARRYREGPDPAGNPRWTVEDSIALYGLPSSPPEKSGPFVIQRFQRIAFQHWVEDAPNAPAKGSVVPVLGGDLLAEAGLIPAEARTPEPPQ